MDHITYLDTAKEELARGRIRGAGGEPVTLEAVHCDRVVAALQGRVHQRRRLIAPHIQPSSNSSGTQDRVINKISYDSEVQYFMRLDHEERIFGGYVM